MVANEGKSSGKDEWILDLGCSYHMCPNRDYFYSYQLVTGEIVLMGKNVAFKTVGMGIIWIKTYDEVVKTLIDIRDVSDLKKILISLGVLDSNECKIIIEPMRSRFVVVPLL